MQLIDSRRLRGPNLQILGPAAVAEVALEPGEDSDASIRMWREELERLAAALGFAGVEQSVARPFPGGVSFAVPAPIDVLYAATEINEWAIASASARHGGGAPDEAIEEARARIAGDLEDESKPALVALHQAARQRGVPMLWDDELVTLGLAARGRSYPIDDLPEVSQVPWTELGTIPVALVTGTNGKTTSARLLARMVREAGRRVGNTSTDGIAIDGVLIESGDWTGAEAARRLLRRTDIDVAVLETARGGILRRGLAVERADAALLLNISADHMGEFGVYDLDTMARAKAVVGTVVMPSGHVVVNADDPRLLALAVAPVPTFRAPVALFSLHADSPAIAAHRARGGVVLFPRGGAVWRAESGRETRLASIADIPIAFGGAASYNIGNALGAAGVAWSLGIADEAITRALLAFTATDNPGRGQSVTLPSGVSVLTDFGHNPAAFDAVFALARSLRTARGQLIVATMQAGDRTDDALAAQAAAIARAKPTRALVFDTPHLLRGRQPGEVPEILSRELRARGVPRVDVVETEVEALDAALAEAQPGDLVVIAPNIDRVGIRSALAARGL
jgi:cyanophycin synthetase